LTRLAILASHPVQYYAPLFRGLAKHTDLHVFYAHQATPAQQAAAGFGTSFEWDVDLTEGYAHSFLRNVALDPGTDRFGGCDTPEIGARLKEGRFDAVLALGWHLKSMIQGILAAKRLGMATLVRGDSHLHTPRSTLKRLIKAATYPHLLRVFDAVLYVGTHNRTYFEHYSYPSKRLFHSPHCIDTERFAMGATARARATIRNRFGIRDDEHVVLFAGKLLPFKRPLDVVEALGVIAKDGRHIRMMIAGSGPLETEVRNRADQLGVCVTFLGFQNQTEMPAAFAAADLLVLPSNGRETWGLVCNEALACGLPIIVSDKVGCAPDLAADGIVGRAFPLGDIMGLAAAIEACIATPATREDIKRLSNAHSIDVARAGIMDALTFLVLSEKTEVSSVDIK
jgi:glycosyltransferase involved in cell wall biosynthesis